MSSCCEFSQNGQTTSFTPDALGRLKSATLPDATQIDYKLDWDGRRATRAVNGTQTHRNVFENELRIAASREDGVVKEYVFGTSINSPDYVKIAGLNYRIVKDHLGSPRLVVNATDGSIAQRMDYNEWGKVTHDSNPGFQQYGFAGGIYDQATKLVKFGARDYDARVGRWTSKDPIRFDGGDTNLYGYVLQDPVNWMDAEGLAPFDGRTDFTADKIHQLVMIYHEHTTFREMRTKLLNERIKGAQFLEEERLKNEFDPLKNKCSLGDR